MTSCARQRPVVLAFFDYYTPGYLAGGPIRTAVNLVERLGDEIDFRVITRDRDMHSNCPFAEITSDVWTPVGKAHVFYASPAMLKIPRLVRLLRETRHDVLYLNSFFSVPFSILPILIRHFAALDGPVVLAPRGEFAPAALALQRTKKSVYLFLSRIMGSYRRVLWHASSEKEAADIRRAVAPLANRICIAPNLVCAPAHAASSADRGGPRPNRQLRLVFLSRIAPMKNLDYLLRVLRSVRTPVQLTIHGPAEDAQYWAECRRLINDLPAHISIIRADAVDPLQVHATLTQHDLFVLPSRGENFGHVVFESLAAGTPVMVSDRTPWQPDDRGGVEVLSLDQPQAWSAAIERWAQSGEEDCSRRRAAALEYARQYLNSDRTLDLNRQLFLNAAGNGAEIGAHAFNTSVGRA